MRTLFIAGSLIALSSAAAFADAQHLHATLVNPPKEQSFLLDSVAWRCDGTSCVSASPLQDAGPRGQCRALAKKVGPVASFEDFDSAKLQACNAAKG
jgi:hypothetical protein